MSFSILVRAVAAIGLIGIGSHASADTHLQDKKQAYGVDTALTATYGTISLDSGFTNDPYRVSIRSGGGVDASTVSDGCTGTVAQAPDFELTYVAGGLPLTFGVDASVDTTLVINGPDGLWSCDDDSGSGTNPEITYRDPRSGIYDVWVGTFGGDDGQAELFVTEMDRNEGGDGGDYPDASATATYGEVRLESGFTNDPYRVSVLAGGSLNASTVHDQCQGTIASAPDFQLTFAAGSLPLIFRVTSGGDVTLVINGPDGVWHCDDDSGNGSDAVYTFEQPKDGIYDVWVGAYNGDSVSAELSISERR